MSCKEHVQYVSFQIRGKFRDDFHVINNARSIPKLALSKQTVFIQDVNHSHLKDISSELTYDDAQPTILIGAEDWPLTLPQKVKSGSCKQPIAALTALGWVVYGASYNKLKSVEFVNNVTVDDENTPSSPPSLVSLATDSSRFSNGLRMVRATARALLPRNHLNQN
jgi:hypothetical protein